MKHGHYWEYTKRKIRQNHTLFHWQCSQEPNKNKLSTTNGISHFTLKRFLINFIAVHPHSFGVNYSRKKQRHKIQQSVDVVESMIQIGKKNCRKIFLTCAASEVPLSQEAAHPTPWDSKSKLLQYHGYHWRGDLMLCITCPFLKVQIVFTDLESSDEVGSGVVWARHKSKIVSASRFYHRHSSNLYGDSSPAHDSGMKAMPGRNRVRITLLVSSKKLQGE